MKTQQREVEVAMVVTEEEILKILQESVAGAEELDRELEHLFRLGPEQRNLVLD